MNENMMNEREKMLNEIMEQDFALIDLRLYLDTHPDDDEALNLYNKTYVTSRKIKDEFEQRYGLIAGSAMGEKSGYGWIENPWPWEKTFLSGTKGDK